jgi:superfamily II DNA/RNA helicase
LCLDGLEKENALHTKPIFLQLPFSDNSWPPYERFPYNNVQHHVEQLVESDLSTSKYPLIITGFASLNRLLDFFAACTGPGQVPQTIRILFGHEPFIFPQQTYASHDIKLAQQMKDYWLERKISLHKSTKVLLAISLLESGRLQTRISAERFPLHAKMYRGDRAITIGSSNFSKMGLHDQIEANVRFVSCQTRENPSQEPITIEYGKREEENQRFQEASLWAESFWEAGEDYNQRLLELLKELLKTVTWQEALARACAEVLEGTWAQQYLSRSPLQEGPALWPSQEVGIAQAMWIIEHVGSVLVADATGSGKTRMGANLIKAVMNRIWSRGLRRRQDPSVLICPGSMVDEWEKVSADAGWALKISSDGVLSNKQSAKHDATEIFLRRAQVLAVDEAHRYHSKTSGRTKQLYQNLADHVLLFTATPVNRGPSDLLRLIDILGADNFDEDVLDIFERLGRSRDQSHEMLSAGDIQVLKHAVQQFTVRRTKTMLNAMIDATPERYRDTRGSKCRYPEHIAHFYPCGETVRDSELAEEILLCTGNLHGISRLQAVFRLSESQKRDGVSEGDYIEWRLRAAQNLARYQVMAALRSSKAALIEHLQGTEVACQEFGLKPNKKHTGNIIKTTQDCAGKPPRSELSCALPDWLTNPEVHRQVTEQEVQCYEQILELVRQISDAREDEKTRLLFKHQKEHPLLIAFAHSVITLQDLHHRMNQEGKSIPLWLAFGEDSGAKEEVKKEMQLGSSTLAGIALCSDTMSEGLNLQQASAVVHLDMPSVIRVAEQRVGRIDRLNSPHQKIVCYWPEEKGAFALRSDQKFYERHRFVSDVLGSNLKLPTLETKIVTAQEIVAEVEALEVQQEQEPWRALSDAFEPVRALVEGSTRLVSQQIYEDLRASKARVLSAVSAVRASSAWAFFAVAGTELGTPRWVYLDTPFSDPITDLERVSKELRDHLGQSIVEDHPFDELTASWLDRFLDRLNKTERHLLPKKKQRALEAMQKVLREYKKRAKQQKDLKLTDVLEQFDLLFSLTPKDEQGVDWGTLADSWLDLVRPHWYKLIRNPPRRAKNRPLQLKDLHETLLNDPFSIEQLESILQEHHATPSLDLRVVAAILGIPDEQ